MLPIFVFYIIPVVVRHSFAWNVEDVFVEVEPILRSALDGHNASVLAFGQTGTGKTFTMVSDKTFDSIVLLVAAYISFVIQ